MRRSLLLLLLAALGTWGLAQEPASEAVQAEIDAVERAWSEAHAAGDAAAVAETYAVDATFRDATGTVAEGRDAIRDYFGNALADGGEPLDWSPIETWRLGDEVIQIGRWAMPDQPDRIGPYYAAVFAERDGEWRIARHYANGTTPEAPGAPLD